MEYFKLRKYFALLSSLQATAQSLRHVLKCLNNIDVLRKFVRYSSSDTKEKEGSCFSGEQRIKDIPLRNVARSTKMLRNAKECMQMNAVFYVNVLQRQKDLLVEIESNITYRCSTMMTGAIQTMNQANLCNIFQAFYNLKILPVKVYTCLKFLAEKVLKCLAGILDIPAKPSPQEASVLRSELWSQMSLLQEEVHCAAVQAWNLERVLRKMRDPTSHENYLALVQKSKTFIVFASNTHFEGKSVKSKMSCKPFNVFWNMMSELLGKHFSHVATENSL